MRSPNSPAKSPERFLPDAIEVCEVGLHWERGYALLEAGTEVAWDADAKTLTVDGVEYTAPEHFLASDLCTAEEYAELLADRSTEVAA